MKVWLYIFISLAVSSVSNVHAANLSRALFDGVPLESLNSVANEFEFTSDGSQIVFSADFNQDDFFELYAVNVDGSRPRQLSSSSFQMEDDNDFQLAPNGNYVIFRTQDISSGEQGLFGVSLLSDNPTRVNLVPVEGEPNRRLRGSGVISQDSQHIVVTTAASALSPDNRFFAISVNGDIGNQPLSLSQSTLIHSHDSFFGPELTSGTFTPDGDYITSYFAGVFGGAGSAEVFRLSMSGGPAIQLSDDDLPPSSFDGIIFVDLSSDGQFLLYRRIINGSLHIARTNTAESSMQISPDDEMVIGISVIGGVPSFSRDARSIVFDSSTDDVSLGGNFTTSKTLITNPLFPAGGNTSAIPNFVTPDSVSTDALAFSDNNDVYYLASTNNEQQLTLFNGANPVSFIPQGGAFSFIRSHMHSDDGDISVFVASNQFTGGIDQVYVHDRQNSPGEIVRITDTQQANTVLQTNGINLSPDASFVIVSTTDDSGFSFSDLSSGIVNGLLLRAIGSDENIDITPTLVTGGNILSLKISPDSRTLAYTADRDRDGLLELYSIDLTAELGVGSESTNELCFPIVGQTGNTALICL